MNSRSIVKMLLILPLVLLFLAGCVRRTVTINTAPQGARIILNDEEVGTSPVSVDFTWYGDYDVIVRHEGYETLQTHHRLNAPWYQIPPIDLFAEALVPFTIHDRHEMYFELEPRKPIDRTQLVKEAGDIRDRTLYGTE